MIALLDEVHDEARFGGKAAQLGAAMRAGLPVPAAVAVAHDATDDVADIASAIASRVALARGVAVRSSAVGEDGVATSFAGQHLTCLGIRCEAGLADAIARVRASAHDASALAYRRRLDVGAPVRMAVVVQGLVHADVAGVLFSHNPVTGADERVVEATWGLGEAVVAGLVTPDRFRFARGGAVRERTLGDKDLMIVYDLATGGTVERETDERARASLCLDDAMLAMLEALTARAEAVFGGTQDLEFAFEGRTLHLLQRRAITRFAS